MLISYPSCATMPSRTTCTQADLSCLPYCPPREAAQPAVCLLVIQSHMAWSRPYSVSTKVSMGIVATRSARLTTKSLKP